MRKRELSQQDDELATRLSDVRDPVLFRTLGELGTLRKVNRSRNGIEVAIAVPNEEYPGTDELAARISSALNDLSDPVRVSLEVLDDDERAALGRRLVELAPKGSDGGTTGSEFSADRRGRSRVIAIASGKGGVGKSSVTVNLAVALAALGHSVGLLDADIYGFSVPRMLGVTYAPILLGEVIVPPIAHGVRVVSMGFFADEDQAVAWRGPMLHKALEQFLGDVQWGAPEFLIVDMPPGTGDVSLSVAEQLSGAEMIVVTTPQPAAQRVAQRSGSLARQLRLPIRGVVENMAWFEGDDGVRYELFGSGGGAALASSLEVPLLAQIPLVREVRIGADVGEPAVVADPTGQVARIFTEFAERLVKMGAPRVYRSELRIS